MRHGWIIARASFSPDGRYVLTASFDHTARVWDAATAEPVTPPLQHSDWVMHAAFSPDGRRVVTASADGTARVWALPSTDRPVRELILLAEMLSGVRLDPTAGSLPLDAEALQDRWRRLRSLNRANPHAPRQALHQ
jgi:WD40 repeat protein